MEDPQTPPEETADEETLTGEETEEGTQATGEPEVDYKTKFAESSKEAMRLLDENKRLAAEATEKEHQLQEAKEAHQRQLEEIAETNPGGVELSTVKESLRKIEGELKEQKTIGTISDFISAHPETAAHRATLIDLKKLYPQLTAQQIWEEKLKPVYEKGAETKGKEIREKEAAQPETGEGTVTGEPGGGTLTAEQFSKLSLDKQKEYLKRRGIR
jgi:predicted nuclease with TOPRIM domain